jgi:hypothetical protein
MQERNYPEDLDFGWIAADCEGRVGVFVTGGRGPVPRIALLPGRSRVEEIESLLDGLPSFTTAKAIVQLKRPDDFVEAARRGLFAYDWTDVHRSEREALGSYELIAAPDQPISVTDLPKEIADLLEGIVLEVSFAQERLIDVTKHLECRRTP